MKRIRHFILSVLVFLVFVAFAARLIGVESYNIETTSMEPSYNVNDMVYTYPVEFEKIKIGDVVTYIANDNTVVTHRVVDIDKEDKSLKTKGDNNEYSDINPVYYENVIGKVCFKIPYIGIMSKHIRLFEKIQDINISD